MLRKIISIQNVGKFRNSAAIGNPELERHTLILGANGFGKTTICAVLRSLQSGDPDHIMCRKTLGVDDTPIVELLLPDGMSRFDGAAWSAPYSALAIFDGVFVSENVHSGEVVNLDHKRNLYRVIIGAEGVRLAQEDTRLAMESREKTGQITTAAAGIQPHVPAGMTLAQFIAVAADPEIDAKIAEQEVNVEAVRQAKQIGERPTLSEITIPTMPANVGDLLSRTIDDIANDAETRLATHLSAHGMDEGGQNWIVNGLSHADHGTCPFCGQNIQDLPLIAAYRAVFSDAYKALRDEAVVMRTDIAQQFGDAALGSLKTRVEQNKGATDFWGRFCTFDPKTLALPDDIPEAVHSLGQAAINLLDRKSQAPLEAIPPDEAFTNAAKAYEAAQATAREIAETTRAVNAMIVAKKEETGAVNVQTAESEFARRRAIQVRHSNPVDGLCADYVRLTAEKEDIDNQKTKVRTLLDEHTNNVIRRYEGRINHYLDIFNTGFSITETRHSYPGGIASSSYQLVVNDTAIELGDGQTSSATPSFKNALSSGDRSTLALAFFLAHLEADENLKDKTVVFDDPINSQDTFRRRQTVHEITKVAHNCAQIIVLSHDATFLKQVWDKVPPAERLSLSIADHRSQGSKIVVVDLERACEGRTAIDIDDMQTYLSTGAGAPLDLIRKMRVVLETHCWTTYPASFHGNDSLGDMIRKIREGGDQHPAKDLYDELDQINDYNVQYHHGEKPDMIPDQIDPIELTSHVKRTLKIANALQA